MTGKKIIFYILAAFVIGNLFIIYIQYNSSKNTTALIKGNEQVLSELNVTNNLKELEKDIISVESKIRGTVSTTDISYIDGLQAKINAVENNLHQLQKISDNDFSILYIDELDTLVRKKLLLSRQILNVYQNKGQEAAQNLILKQGGKKITDSIATVTFLIDSTRKTLLTKVTNTINKSGKKVQQLNTVLITLVLLVGLILFWYIINTVHKQSQLIEQLNISEKKVKEGARLKEKFLANMSHEIRTPMNAILGFTNLLDRKIVDDESKKYLQTIKQSGKNLLAIINDILDLSKIEEGMMRIEYVPFNVRDTVWSVENMFKSEAAQKGLDLNVSIDSLLPEKIIGDPARLTQLLVNLISNALKFTEKGDIKIKITQVGIEGKNILIGITVADTGIGIEKNNLSKVFERFEQAEDSVTRTYGGTGLGLAIVKEMVHLQKGTIDVESVVGRGSTFKIILPYQLFDEKIAVTPSVVQDMETSFFGKDVCVLVAEDNLINQTYISHLFKEWNLKFDLVNNGKEVIDALSIKYYDLVLMDIQMPIMDGYSATVYIRKNLKNNIPIVAMTAHSLMGEKEKCLSYGMNEYISKPINEQLLKNIIQEFSNKKILQYHSTQKDYPTDKYKYIQLDYLQSVSAGNIEFEKKITKQFIDIIPVDLQTLFEAWENKNVKQVKNIAHNMKTSISVMGLNDTLEPYLDTLEYSELTAKTFTTNFLHVKSICNFALEEANRFYKTIA